MSFHVSAWSIKNPVPTIVAFLTLGIVGLISFLGLGIDNSPNIDVPAVIITVTQRGAGPAELESQVTKKIEDAVAGLGNIDQIISTVTDGSSTWNRLWYWARRRELHFGAFDRIFKESQV